MNFIFFCRVLIVGCCVGVVEAQTLYAFSEDRWTDSFKIFFGNKMVQGSHSKTLKPQKDWDSIHSELLDLEAISQSKTLFALSNTSLQSQALLYIWDSQKDRELGCESLGRTLSRGALRASTVFYEKRWRMMLLVLGEDAVDKRVHLWMLELNEQGNALRFIRHWPLEASYHLGSTCLKPLFIRRIGKGESDTFFSMHRRGVDPRDGRSPNKGMYAPEVHWEKGIAAAGITSVLWTVQEGSRGVVCRLDLKTQKISKAYAQGGAFSKLNAIDQWGRGICDALYLVNEQGLWLLPLEDTQDLNFRHLAKLRVDSKIMVLPHTEHPGWQLYFIGQSLGKQGLWTLEVLQEDSRHRKPSAWLLEPECLLEGAFSDLDLCAGRVWLIPTSIKKPWIWDIAGKVLITQNFRDVFSEGNVGSVLGVQLAWDGQHKEHKIILVNQEAQITVFASSAETIGNTGRLAFRKS